jgi:hypothetical protein
MGLEDVIKSALGAGGIPPELLDLAKSGGIDLLLSGDSERMLSDMISKGTFGNKADFVTFLVSQYMKNNVGSMMAGDKQPSESAIMDIINKTGIGKGFMEGDVKKYLVPLLITGFFAIYRLMSKRQATKPA